MTACNCEHLHYFDIGPAQFSCIYDWDYKHKPLWYVNHISSNDCWNFDLNKGFKSAEACEEYMRNQVYKVCKQIIKEFK